MRSRKKLTIGIVLVGTALVLAALPVAWEAYSDLQDQRKLDAGRALAGVYCASCHLEPVPDILPKRSWEAALGHMGYWLGMENIDYLADHPDFAQETVRSRRVILARDNALPNEPLLEETQWEALRYYYVERAPSTTLPQIDKPELRWELPQFRIVRSNYRIPNAVTTLVHIRESTREVYLGDSGYRTLTVLDSDGRRKVGRRFRPDIFPVDIEFVDDIAYVGSIGDLRATRASAEKPAHISALALVDRSIANASSTVVVDDLYRLADIEVVDLNGDGRMDFIVCGFGSILGNLSWLESQTDGSYIEHVLLSLPGAVRVETHDFNDDGLLDIIALMSDAREGLHLLINRGGNEFEYHTIFETHPSYGHTYFELQDFNGDGLMDVLVVNGDNVDSDPYNTLKNYHGLRIYLNRGDYRFEEAYFYPMYGAFIAKSADFDNDGDLDIAAISFYPDFAAERRESFTYLQNDGGLAFSAYTNEELMGGRWMTLDVGDMDGDGDVDVVLGGAYIPTGMFSYMDDFRELAETGPSVLVLKNTSN